MRIRLRIERNGLPAVSILWTISDTELKQTVAQFLERVNDRFPLEGESWGLEDYAVTIGGYEALHYTQVGVGFQNEDEVIVAPLQYVDVRARTLTGRNQISEDGRHLVDGVPWGRPLLKRARRPDITIPPRKRQRLLDIADELHDENETYDSTEETDDGQPLALLESAGTKATKQRRNVNMDDEGSDESEDEEYDPEHESNEDDSDESEDEEYHLEREPDEETVSSKHSKLKTSNLVGVESTDSDGSDNEEYSSSSDDSDSDGSGSSSDTTSSSSGSDTSSDSSDDASDSSEESWNGITPSSFAPSTKQAQPKTPAQPDSPPEELSSRRLPYEGMTKTKVRNIRRREQKRLKHMKEAGTLPADATVNDLHTYQDQYGVLTKVELQRQKLEHERQRLLDHIAAGGIDITPASAFNGNSGVETFSEEPTVKELQDLDPVPLTKRQKATEPATASSSTVTEVESQPKRPDAFLLTAEGAVNSNQVSPAEPSSGPRRARLDAAGSKRLIFGSLGVRTPKTKAEKDDLQQKLAGRVKHNVSTVMTTEQLPETDEDPDAWREKIEISAVECVDEGVTLSAPPFPFQQRWDPQYQYSKKKRQKKRKHAATNGDRRREHIETYDKYNANGSDALNYDDPEDENIDDEYWEEGALLDDQEEDSIDGGFPDLPADISKLLLLSETDAKEGDIIVFEELACSAATGWQPETIVRTVRLEKNDGDEWRVTFAMRDLRPREFDEVGNRVYSKFEMEGLSDDEGDEDEKVLLWSAMTKPRLLLRSE